jgi:N-acetylmuramoyl-L-alanine amidase
VATILIDLARRQTNNHSIVFARHVVSELDRNIRMLNNCLRSAGFAVLKAPDIPSILVETAFISNPAEERKLRSPREQQRFAESIAGGIRAYFAQNPPLARA